MVSETRFMIILERAVERSLDGAWEGFELRLQELQKASGKRCFLDFASWIRPTGLAFFCPVPTNLSYCQRV